MKRFLHSLRAAVLVCVAAFSAGPATAQVPASLKHTLNDAEPYAFKGYCVAVDGGILVVGSPGDDTAGSDSGAVKVYDSNTGALLHLLVNPIPTGWEDYFGYSVAVSGTRVIVGAFANDTGASNAGRAYVYDLASGTPTVPVATLNNPSPASGDNFGDSVAVSGTRVVVSARYDDTGARNAGSVYVYDLASSTPTVPVAALHNPSPEANDFFGNSISVSGTRVVIGAARDSTGGREYGSAYVYDLASGTPTVPVVTLNNPAPSRFVSLHNFGKSVAVEGARVVVGASGDERVYVFYLASITPTVPVATFYGPSYYENFGKSVALSGTKVVVGAFAASHAGRAYVYDLASGTPDMPVATLSNPSSVDTDDFGTSVAVSDTALVVGAPYYDGAGDNCGAVYIYGPSDGASPTPKIETPATNGFINGDVSVYFVLPVAALPGSVTLTFAGALQTRVVTLADSQAFSGQHWISFDALNPTGSIFIASGLPLEYDGAYTVTLSYRDALGNAAASAVSTNVTLDTVPPTLSGVFSPLRVNFGDAVADYTGQAVSDSANIAQFPHAGTWDQLGRQSLLIVAKDEAENETYLEVFIEVVIPKTTLCSKGVAVPGAGGEGSGIPAGAVWSTFGVPAINDEFQAAVLATYKAGTVSTSAILGWYITDTGGSMTVIAKRGDSAPGIPNAVMSAMKDPLLGPDGSVAWIATLANAPGTSGAVTSADNMAIFLDADGAGPGAAVLVAREGGGLSEGTVWSAFTSVSLGANAVAFTGTLVSKTAGISPGPGGATTLSDSGLWVYHRATATTALALREGDALLGSTIKTVAALVARPGSAGQGRGVANDGEQDYVQVRVTLADSRQSLGFIGEDGTGEFHYVTGDDAPDYGTGAKWGSFGLPTQNPASTAAAFLGTVKSGTGTATSTNNVAIFAENDADYLAAKIVAKGDTAPGVSSGIFSAFKDPVSASNRSVAFSAALKANALAGIGAANNDGIWQSDAANGLALVAREGAQPPEAPAGAQWKAFTSLALPRAGRPMFVGTMHSKIGTATPGPGGVTTADDTALWATDSFGALRLLIREGDAIGASSVKTFAVLANVPGSSAQTRSFNGNGAVILRVTDLTGAQHLVQIAVP